MCLSSFEGSEREKSKIPVMKIKVRLANYFFSQFDSEGVLGFGKSRTTHKASFSGNHRFYFSEAHRSYNSYEAGGDAFLVGQQIKPIRVGFLPVLRL